MTAPRRDFGPHQLADFLGTYRGAVDRARLFGLLPEPDRARGRWCGERACAAAGQAAETRKLWKALGG